MAELLAAVRWNGVNGLMCLRVTYCRWIWIAPPYRWQGLLRDTWSMLTAKYDGILPAPPYSPEAARFFLSLGNLSAHVESAARFALQEAPA